MALIKCIDCGKMISDKSKNCINCGCPTKDSLPKFSKGLRIEGDTLLGVGECKDKIIIIPNNVTKIDKGAFHWAKKITSIIIPDSVTEIGEEAFYGCGDYYEEDDDDLPFGGGTKTTLESVTIGRGVKKIGKDAFSGCDNLKKVNYTGTIDQWAQIEFFSPHANPIFFSQNLYINDILQEEILINAEEIKRYAFIKCESIKKVEFGEKVTSIERQAFWYCSNLTGRIFFPDSVKEIGDSAFSDCELLKEIEFSENSKLKRVEGDSFDYDKLDAIYCNDRIKNLIIEARHDEDMRQAWWEGFYSY